LIITKTKLIIIKRKVKNTKHIESDSPKYSCDLINATMYVVGSNVAPFGAFHAGEYAINTPPQPRE
jgi:hypothetical protein